MPISRSVRRPDRTVDPRPRRLAVTAGDPCGIGPEVLLKALTDPLRLRRTGLVILGDHRVFVQTARRLRLSMPSWRFVGPRDDLTASGDPVLFLDLAQSGSFIPGRPSAAAGRAALTYLETAVSLWRRGVIRGLVTAPVTKWAIQRVQHSFIGQTEYLAEAMGATDVAMMFVSRRLTVVLLTRHVPLRHVAYRVNRALIRRTLELTEATLRESFRVPRPRVAVCGLNPHAGEGGLFGSEERRLLLPVVGRLRARGMRIEGPLAADGLFASGRRFDAVVCWYHDQALIPFKLLARDEGCQFSAGLPMVRTSPDHGSALDIAGRGIAHPGSMRYALRLAARLVQRSRTRSPQREQFTV